MIRVYVDCPDCFSVIQNRSYTIIGIIRVYEGSYTHTYCVENDIDYELIDSDTPDTSLDDFVWEKTENGDGMVITEYMGTATEVSVPSRIKGLPVTGIGNSAFKKCISLTTITLPEGVTNIDSHAFYGCTSLTSITILNSVTSISFHAFFGCTGLTSITIPNSVTSIDSYAFQNCTSLTGITIPDGVTSIDVDAFEGCGNLTVYASAGGAPNIASRSRQFNNQASSPCGDSQGL